MYHLVILVLVFQVYLCAKHWKQGIVFLTLIVKSQEQYVVSNKTEIYPWSSK